MVNYNSGFVKLKTETKWPFSAVYIHVYMCSMDGILQNWRAKVREGFAGHFLSEIISEG